MPTRSEIGYDSKIEGDVIVTRIDAALNWFRKNSLWPMPMGLACCAIELMAAGASRFDISRFGSEVMRFLAAPIDVMIVAGTVTYKMARRSNASTIRWPSRNGSSPWAPAPPPAACTAVTPCCKGWTTSPGGYLCGRLPAAARSAARRADETAKPGATRAAVGDAEESRLNKFSPQIEHR